MLRYLHASDLTRYPSLADQMFRDRADQFDRRLGWEVSVDQRGRERDQYDRLDPLYVLWLNEDGTHGGSMRFLPTTGRTMINDHFSHLLAGQPLKSRLIWECTRFCLSRNSAPHVSAALMLGGCEIGLGQSLRFSVGVFDARMVRIYNRLGWSPSILGTSGKGREAISAGLWGFSEQTANRLAERAGVSRALSQHWYMRDAAAVAQLPRTA